MVWQSRKSREAPLRGGVSSFSWVSFGKSLKLSIRVNPIDHSTEGNTTDDVESGYKSVCDPYQRGIPREPTYEELHIHDSLYAMSWIEKEKVKVLSLSKAPGEGGAQQEPFSAREFPKPCPYRHSVGTGGHLSVRTEKSGVTSAVPENPQLDLRGFAMHVLSEGPSVLVSKTDTTHSWDSSAPTQVSSLAPTGECASDLAGDLPHAQRERSGFGGSCRGPSTAKAVAGRSATGSSKGKFIEVFGNVDHSASPKSSPVMPLDHELLNKWLNGAPPDAGEGTSGSSADSDVAESKPRQGRRRREWFSRKFGRRLGKNGHR